MSYVFMLGFENDVALKFQDIIESILKDLAGAYTVDEIIPPHISIASFTADDIDPVIDELNRNIFRFKSGNIVWPSLGMFVPSVLYAAPVLNEYLSNMNKNINRLIEPLSAAGDKGMYLPYNWIPHTTLVSGLEAETLKKAVGAAVGRFSFIFGKTNRLILSKSEPYMEVKTWELE